MPNDQNYPLRIEKKEKRFKQLFSHIGTTSEGIVIKANSLSQATTYRLTLGLQCSGCAGNLGVSHVFTTSSPPEGGTCSVQPEQGEL